MRETTAALAQVTDLMALVTAPPLDDARRSTGSRRCGSSRDVVMVVVITSTGVVTKRVFTFEAPVDPRSGRVGVQLPQRAPGGDGRRRADDRRPARRPRAWARPSAASSPVSPPPSPSSSDDAEETLYVDGASRLLSEAHDADLPRSTS